MNKVALAFSTKDRVELTRRSIEPLLQPDKFDLFWMDGSDTREGEELSLYMREAYLPSRWVTHSNVRGGADAAIVYGLTTLLDHRNNYEYVGLVENDVLLAPGWFEPTFHLFARGEDDGLHVGAVSARAYEDRILTQRDGYALMHNLGAGMVIFRRDAARLVLDNFRTGWTTDNRMLYAQLAGVDIGRWWAFRDHEHAITSDWIYDATLASHGYASLALTPSPCEMIGQVPPLAEQGLKLVTEPVELLRDEKVFETFATKTSLIRESVWYPGELNRQGRQCAIDGTWTIFPHQFEKLGARWSGDWLLKWSQGFGPFSWKAGRDGVSNLGKKFSVNQSRLDLPILGECSLMVSGGPRGGEIQIVDPVGNRNQTLHLWPEDNGNQIMSVVIPPACAYRTLTLTALSEGITIYALRTRQPQPWRPGVRFDHSSLPPV